MEDKLYFKVTNRDDVALEFRLMNGINVKTNQRSNELVYNNFSFTTHEHIHKFYHKGKYLRVIHLPTEDENFIMIYDPQNCVYHANKIILGEKYSLTNPEIYKKFSLPYPTPDALVKLDNLDFIKYLIREKMISEWNLEDLLIESAKMWKYGVCTIFS